MFEILLFNMEKQNSFIMSIKNLVVDVTQMSSSFLYDKVSSSFRMKTREDYKLDILSLNDSNFNLEVIDVNSFGPSNLKIDLSKQKIFNSTSKKANHTEKLLMEFNRKRSFKVERKHSLIINHIIPPEMQMEPMSLYYQYEEYKVLTKDGFILRVFRINVNQEEENTNLISKDSYFDTEESKVIEKNKSFILKGSYFKNQNTTTFKCKNNKQAILLQHGVLDSSDGFLCNKESMCLPLVLARNGFDVWISNSRGNYYSEEHLKYDYVKDKKEYYDYSFDEMGRFDIPSILCKIQEVKNNTNRVILIGHSQGATATLAGMSLNNTFYNEKIKLFIALAPVAKNTGCSSTILNYAKAVGLERISPYIGIYSIAHRSEALTYLTSKHLNKFNYRRDSEIEEQIYPNKSFKSKIKNWFKSGLDLSSFVLGFLTDGSSQDINDTNSLNKLINHVPSGTSMKGTIHYQQNSTSDNFRRFNYGRRRNQQIYGSNEPPEYNIQDITVPTVIMYGLKDKLVNEDDIGFIHSKMIDTILSLEVYENMGHLSFHVGKDSKWIEDVLKRVKEFASKE